MNDQLYHSIKSADYVDKWRGFPITFEVYYSERRKVQRDFFNEWHQRRNNFGWFDSLMNKIFCCQDFTLDELNARLKDIDEWSIREHEEITEHLERSKTSDYVLLTDKQKNLLDKREFVELWNSITWRR